ncbi:imelysin family protein [Paracoccus sp. TK19116]|uniref:Imelysin family protein n=1 Tax=Paracoccus albicereus TaxID=2922394 RepID=A0ABT1MQ66_9RHOB|nr:imelysin family protein [Paracoccus albicereus]MCQ0970269.1 imelysin family protein [Paracoccus albicereus]
MARIALIVSLAAMLAASAHADTAEAVNDVILPAYDELAEKTTALADTAAVDCSADALRDPYQAAWDAWASIDYLAIGPIQQNGRALAMSFWPDTKNSGRRAQQALVDAAPPAIDDPQAFADLSVALRGLGGLERLIYPSGVEGDEAVLCRLRAATAADLARMAGEIRTEWDDYASMLLDAGDAGNTTYLTADEARQALFTQVMAGLEHTADTRLGRPLGTFDKPRPERAEAIPAGRSLRNVRLSLEGMRDLAMALYPDAPLTRAAFDRAIGLADDLDDPVLAGVAEPAGRLKVEILQQAVRATRETMQAEIGGALGLSVGFNSKDGD